MQSSISSVATLADLDVRFKMHLETAFATIVKELNAVLRPFMELPGTVMFEYADVKVAAVSRTVAPALPRSRRDPSPTVAGAHRSPVALRIHHLTYDASPERPCAFLCLCFDRPGGDMQALARHIFERLSPPPPPQPPPQPSAVAEQDLLEKYRYGMRPWRFCEELETDRLLMAQAQAKGKVTQEMIDEAYALCCL
jgi:hypothetical protein